MSQDIEMQVEAVRLDGSMAEVIVSFRDTGGRDRIRGKVDMYDSYNLTSLTGHASISGSSFIEYDEDSDKALFKVTLWSEDAFDREKLTFRASELLIGLAEENSPIDLSSLTYQAGTKAVSLSGKGVNPDAPPIPEGLTEAGTEEDPRPRFRSLDTGNPADCSPETFTMTGAVYMDGLLRVQYCMGDNTHADRHMMPYLLNKDGTKHLNDYSFSWFEDVDGERLTFYEFCFVGPFEDPASLPLYGDFYDTGESVQGDWSVTFRLG